MLGFRDPDNCCLTDDGNPVDVTAWDGPKGAIPPLHHNPKKLLTHVVNEKWIFLFSSDDFQYLYPHETELLCNTARIDPRDPDQYYALPVQKWILKLYET